MSLLSRWWPMNVTVYEDRSEGRKKLKLKARKIKTREGVLKLQMSNNEKTNWPESKYITEDNEVYLYSPQRGTYHFLQQKLDFETNTMEFKPVKQEQRQLYVAERQKIEERKKRLEGMFTKVMPIVIILVIAIGAMLIIKSTMDGLQPIAADMKVMAEAMKAASSCNATIVQGW